MRSREGSKGFSRARLLAATARCSATLARVAQAPSHVPYANASLEDEQGTFGLLVLQRVMWAVFSTHLTRRRRSLTRRFSLRCSGLGTAETIEDESLILPMISARRPGGSSTAPPSTFLLIKDSELGKDQGVDPDGAFR
jgi:hypothetical protein